MREPHEGRLCRPHGRLDPTRAGLRAVYAPSAFDPAVLVQLPFLPFAPTGFDATKHRGSPLDGPGFDHLAVTVTADFDPAGRLPICWTGPDRYDDGHLDRCIEELASIARRPRVIFQMTTCSPDWWDDAHPRELALAGDGDAHRLLPGPGIKTTVPSLASRRWHNDMAANLERLVRRIEGSKLASHVSGYVVAFADSGSWIHCGTRSGYLSDYSEPMRQRWREWLCDRYGSIEQIREAWGRSIRLSEIDIPSPRERARVDPRGFRHPLRQRPVIDYLACLAELTAWSVGVAVAAVRRAAGEGRLVGVRFGDLLNMTSVQDGLQHSGQLGLSRVLALRDLDFLVAPAAADANSDLLEGCCSSSPETSLRRHGKLLMHACRAPGDRALHNAIEFAVHKGHGLWWEPAATGPTTPRPPASLLARLRPASGCTSGQAGTAALVIDDVSMFYLQRPAQHFVNLLRDQAFELARSQIDHDVILFEDLDPVCSYRLLLVPNLFYVDSERRRRLHTLLEGSGTTVLWIGGPGFMDRDARFENIEGLVGMRIVKPPRPHAATIVVDAGDGALRYGNESTRAHWPVVGDETARVVGRYAESGLPGLAVKEQKGWRSVFSGAPAVCAEVVRWLAREAGVFDPGEPR